MLVMMSVKAYAKKMDTAESTIRKMCSPGGLLYAVSEKIGVGYKIDVEAADTIFRERMEKKQPAAARTMKRQKSFLAEIEARKQALRKEMCG